MFAAHHIVLTTNTFDHTAIQWWQIPVTTFRPIKVGRIEDASAVVSYAYPSIAVNQFNDVLVGYSRFSSNQWPSANYSFRDTCRAAYEDLQTDTVLKNGISYYAKLSGARNRWGDYSATVVDPRNDSDLWTVQEYADQYASPFDNSYSGRWGTWWGKIVPLVYSNDTFASATVISDYSGTNYASLARATRESGEPNHAGTNSSPSLWYRWTAPSTVYARFTVTNALACPSAGDSSDTTIAIYTGSAVNSLTGVATNHAPGGTNVVFHAISNTTYQVTVAGYGGRRGDFTLIWRPTNAPMITINPKDYHVVQGTNVTFSVTVFGDPAPTYQWRRHGNLDLNIITNIPGATNSDYTLFNVSTNDTGYYSVMASNSLGTDVSRIARLQVYSTNAAVISDWIYSTNQWRQVVSGITGNVYVVQVSTNLIDWLDTETNTVTFTNADNTITNYPYRFYRVRTQ